MLQAIAQESSIDWDSKALESKLYSSTPKQVSLSITMIVSKVIKQTYYKKIGELLDTIKVWCTY
jgi:hypothetical protein